MNPCRHLFLVLILVFAQLAAGAHAIGHSLDQGDGLAPHSCELCLAAHDLGAAAVACPPALPVAAAAIDRVARVPAWASRDQSWRASQRAPPTP